MGQDDILTSPAVAAAFERAYQKWRADLVESSEDATPWADLTGTELLQGFLAELKA